MIVEPRHSKIHMWLLNAYINRILSSNFSEVKITGSVLVDENRPVLLVPNHFSWWDGFFAWYLNQRVINKQFHIMMLESELRKHMFFSRVGAFSINRSSRSIVESIEYCRRVLSAPQNLLVMYPQGELQSQHHNRVEFRKGVEKILSKTPNVQVVFAVCLTDYYAKQRPSLTIALKDYKGGYSIAEVESAFNEHLLESKINQDNIYPR